MDRQSRQIIRLTDSLAVDTTKPLQDQFGHDWYPFPSHYRHNINIQAAATDSDYCLFTRVCFGCGPANPSGLHIKSTVLKCDETGIQLVAEWSPKEVHCGYPAMLYGGITAALFDCHSTWTAMIYFTRQTASTAQLSPAVTKNVQSSPSPKLGVTYFCFASQLTVRYRRPGKLEPLRVLSSIKSIPGTPGNQVVVECTLTTVARADLIIASSTGTWVRISLDQAKMPSMNTQSHQHGSAIKASL